MWTICFHLFFIYRLIDLFSYILLNLFIDYFIGLDFIGNNFNINVFFLLEQISWGNLVLRHWYTLMHMWQLEACMKANRAAGRQVKIMGKPGVKADK